MSRWYPVARAAEIIPHHVGQTHLLGQEIALWRTDGGEINAWENRCPHRGVRLSIGINTGHELRCRYHGWRFASGTGQCKFIPAHPTQRPASTIKVKTHPVAEYCNLVWVNVDPPAGDFVAPVEIKVTPEDRTLRSIFVNAPVEAVNAALSEGYRIDAHSIASVSITDAFTLIAHARGAGKTPPVIFLLQPNTSSQTVIHGIQPDAPASGWADTLRHHNSQLSELRDRVEQHYSSRTSKTTTQTAPVTGLNP